MAARISTLVAVIVLATSVHDARAQAWVPPKGEGSVAVAFQNTNVKDHIATTTRFDAGQIDTNTLLADVTYGLTDRIAVDFVVPFVRSKYTGTKPHPGTNIDDGSYRGSFTDLHVTLRYNLRREGTVITPYVSTIVPSHDYAFYGHAAPGQRLRQLQIGVYAARLINRGVPGMFVSGRYGYGFVQPVLDMSLNKSSGDLEAGYFITPSVRAFGIAKAQYTHGGIDFPLGGLAALPAALRPVHDQVQRVHYLELGAGAAYSVTDTIDVFGSFVRLVAGRNGHALNRGITVGASWSFTRTSKPDGTRASAFRMRRPDAVSAKKEGSLVRCMCQKPGA